MKTNLISVVVPIYNEANNIPVLYRRLKKVLSSINSKHELIFINDGSSDNSLNLLKQIRKTDRKIKIVSFSRNFGHMQAIQAGLANTNGKKVVVMDADLQDPPEVITRMYQKSKDGYDVVYGVKKKRKENFLKRFLFSFFYFLLSKISKVEMPLDAGTFSLLDRKVVKILISLPEKNKFFSGLRSWAGYKQTGVVYERGKRIKGQSKSINRLIGLALDGLISFSFLPLRIASYLGFLFAGVSFVFIIFVIVGRVVFGLGIVGWASTLSIILLIGGVQLITLGIIGEYLGRIHEEVKNRPDYLITEKIGF